MRNVIILLVVSVLVLAGCPVPAGTGGGNDSVDCTETSFAAIAEDAGEILGSFIYLAQSSLGDPVDTLKIEFAGGAPSSGSIEIEEANYSTCTTCVRIDLGCDGSLSNCTKTLLAQGGTLVVTSTGAAGDTFSGELQNVQFVEVTIDGTNVSTAVPGGDEVCLPSFAFSTTIQ